MSIPKKCFFLDTSVILSDIFKEKTRTLRIEKLKKDSKLYNTACHASESVKTETYKKVQEMCDFLANTVRETIKYQLEDRRKKKGLGLDTMMDVEDIKELENLFIYYNQDIRKTRDGFPLLSPISFIEEWAIQYLADILDKVAEIDTSQFLRELIKVMLKLTSSFEDQYDDLLEFEKGYIKINKITSPLIKAKLETVINLHEPDSDHLASAIAHKDTTKENTVFVTFDYGTILNIKDALWEHFQIRCCDPLYAIYYL